jgi:cytochrome c553
VERSVCGEDRGPQPSRGDIARGAAAFEICQGCHRAGALGRADGSYPRLAGQHANVLVKQMADVRSGRRSNLKMLPFADHQALSVQDIADIAVLPAIAAPFRPPRDRGRAPIWHVAVNSTNVIARSATGSRARARRTNSSPGFPASTTPTCCAKAAMIRDGKRHNAHPDMVLAIGKYSDEDTAAVSDYISRLPVGGR